jgi:nitrite reductase (NADH) small subunit
MNGERAIGHLSQVPPGEGRNFDVDGIVITVFRTRAGELFATQPRCPHRQGPLADGLLGGTLLVCPLHDLTFDLRTGRSMAGDCQLQTYPVRLAADGRIMLAPVNAPAEVN